MRQMDNLIKYTNGFLEGAQSAMPFFLASVGEKTKEMLEQFIDANARSNPESLHHVYEWYETGNSASRLFEIEYRITSVGLSMSGELRQSRTVKNGSREPFYDKARIMEEGVGVTIVPRRSAVLVFEDGGKTVFTKNSVRVENPGGAATQGSFDRVFETFFTAYFRQSFLQMSGLRPVMGTFGKFSQNLNAGLKTGSSAGRSAGADWIREMGTSL